MQTRFRQLVFVSCRAVWLCWVGRWTHAHHQVAGASLSTLCLVLQCSLFGIHRHLAESGASQVLFPQARYPPHLLAPLLQGPSWKVNMSLLFQPKRICLSNRVAVRSSCQSKTCANQQTPRTSKLFSLIQTVSTWHVWSRQQHFQDPTHTSHRSRRDSFPLTNTSEAIKAWARCPRFLSPGAFGPHHLTPDVTLVT